MAKSIQRRVNTAFFSEGARVLRAVIAEQYGGNVEAARRAIAELAGVRLGKGVVNRWLIGEVRPSQGMERAIERAFPTVARDLWGEAPRGKAPGNVPANRRFRKVG